MKKLFLKTDKGLVPLDEELVKKYNLKQGQVSPFSRYWIVDENGSLGYNDPSDDVSTPGEMPEGEGIDNDEIEEFSETHAVMSQSEIIDFSQGTDSSPR